MAVKTNPRKLRGPWTDGFALDVHTTGSTFLGYNAYGHPEFDTRRSPLGELAYRLKNLGDRNSIEPIVETVAGFLNTWNLKVDMIVPVPPSNTARKNQPVIEVANALSEWTKIPVCSDCISRVKNTAQLKDVFDVAKRAKILADAFSVDRTKTGQRRLLLFDDLFRSGATASAIAKLLVGPGGASAVYLLTLTQTRKKL